MVVIDSLGPPIREGVGLCLREFAKRFALKLDAKTIARIEEGTQGVPLAVKDAYTLLRDGANVKEVLEDLKHKRGQLREIVRGVAERFLKYCKDKPEVETKVFHLAMLRQFDDRVLPRSFRFWRSVTPMRTTRARCSITPTASSGATTTGSFANCRATCWRASNSIAT